MGKAIREVADRLVGERLVRESADRLFTLTAKAQREGWPKPLQERLRQLAETVDNIDWGKLAVMLGLLFYKVDRLIGDVEANTKVAQGTEKNTGDLVAKMDSLIRAIQTRKQT